MSVDIYTANAQDDLSAQELALYHLIMDYRAERGLAPIPLSADLTLVAGRHVLDTTENIWGEGLDLPEGANLHSWSGAPYFSDHRAAEVMWDAPQRLGTDYPGMGFEISAAGYSSIEAALVGWQRSEGHNQVIVNEGIWASQTWNAIGIGVEMDGPEGGIYGGRAFHVWFGREADIEGPRIIGEAIGEVLTGTGFVDRISGGVGNDWIDGGAGNDTLSGGLNSDTLIGGEGDDYLTGGDTADDVHDVIYGGAGDDWIDGGYGNDELRGDGGHDTIAGGFGADTVIGGGGEDQLTGSAFGDMLFGGDGNDFINGGFGSDLVNGGAGADEFFHIGIDDHGSDWIQDYSADEGDVLVFGNEAASAAQFQINAAFTEGAGDADVADAFVIYRPTGQILWALVDGMGEDNITIQIDGMQYDLM